MKHAIQAVIEQELRAMELRLREVEGEAKERASTDSETGSKESVELARSLDLAEREADRQHLILSGAQTLADAVLAEMGVPVPSRDESKRLRAKSREDF